MKLSDKSEILLQRYLLAVERRLPWTGRKDMIAEIKSNLMDTLEDHYPPEEVLSEDKLEEELRKLGSPASVASSYYTSDALIGPQHNYAFRLIVQYLVPIVAGSIVLAGIISFIVSGSKSPFWSLTELIGSVWQVSVAIIGTAAIVFMILTRYFPQVNQEEALKFLEEQRKDWRISDLPEIVKTQDKVAIWEPILGIVFGFIALGFWLFLFDDWGGLWWLTGEQWHMVPIFTQAFITFIPWIVVNTGLTILLNIILAIQGRRTILSRVFDILIKISELSLVAVMLRAGKLVSLDAQAAVTEGLPVEAVEGIQLLLNNNFVHWFLIFLVVVLSIDLLKKLIELVKSVLKG